MSVGKHGVIPRQLLTPVLLWHTQQASVAPESRELGAGSCTREQPGPLSLECSAGRLTRLVLEDAFSIPGLRLHANALCLVYSVSGSWCIK